MNKITQNKEISESEKKRVFFLFLHLGKLVGGTAGDLGDTEEGELRLEILQLVQKFRL